MYKPHFDWYERLKIPLIGIPLVFSTEDVKIFHPITATSAEVVGTCAELHNGEFYIRVYAAYDSGGQYCRQFHGPYRTTEAAESVAAFVTGLQLERIGQ